MRKLFLLILCFSTYASANQSDSFVKEWSKLVKMSGSAIDELQPGCVPRIIKANSNVRFKGTIVLVHGFTACPQQYFEFASQYLAPQGFDVVLPLIPGHGREISSPYPIKVRTNPLDKWYTAPVEDDLSKLYTFKSGPNVVKDFAKQINEMMKYAKGQKLIGGLSGGAAVVARAIAESPKLYKRAVIKNGFFKISKDVQGQGAIGKVAPQLVYMMGKTGLWANYRGSFKDTCEIDGRNVGRAGYCQFTNNALAGMQKFGMQASRALKNQADQVSTKIQFIMVEKDYSVANKEIKKLYHNLSKKGVNTKICTYLKGTNHEIISKYEAPFENKFWLNSLLEDYSEYLVSDLDWPINGKSQIHNKISLCEIR